MKIIFVDLSESFCEAAQKAFKDLPNIEVVQDYFEKLPAFDCMVSPANSFGLMDGGVDAAITKFFGVQLMQRVQERILTEYLGEQPVGTSMIVETGNPKHPFLAHTPTMRIPMHISKTDNVYLSMWALLRAVHFHNKTSERKIEIIACPGLGTGTGRVPYEQAARQMALAYKNYLNQPLYLNWGLASARQGEIVFGGDDGCDISPYFS